MIEQQLRNLELSEPPLGFDPDVVVDRIELSAVDELPSANSGLLPVIVPFSAL